MRNLTQFEQENGAKDIMWSHMSSTWKKGVEQHGKRELNNMEKGS